MNEELEKWIEENSPKQTYGTFGSCLSAEWKAGATAMAEHLEEVNREENDAAFYLGAGVQKNQPPTRETLEKFLRIAEAWTGGKLNPIIVDYILEHWNE